MVMRMASISEALTSASDGVQSLVSSFISYVSVGEKLDPVEAASPCRAA